MTKQQAYEKATMQSISDNPNGTRMDVIYLAMAIYAYDYAKEQAEQPQDKGRELWDELKLKAKSFSGGGYVSININEFSQHYHITKK